MTVPENVENQNYGRPIDPSEIVPEPKPASPGGDETQVMTADSRKEIGEGLGHFWVDANPLKTT